jgi:hypothetical protein
MALAAIALIWRKDCTQIIAASQHFFADILRAVNSQPGCSNED